MNIFQWLKKQGYEYTWNIRIGTKTPDIIAFKDREILIFEIKRHATEISNAVGQCLFYLQNANKVCIILSFKEIKKIKSSSLNLIKKHGIGLIQANKNVKILMEPKFFNFYNKEFMKKLKDKSLSKTHSNYKRLKSFGEEIRGILKEHPEGLSINDIANNLSVHRHTIVKYIYQLFEAGSIYQIKIGPAKMCYLKVKK